MTDEKKTNFPAIEGLGSIASDWGELAIDSLMNDGFAKDIPILGTIVNLFKSGANVKEHLFRKKIEGILNSISDVSEEELRAFNSQFEEDPKFATRVAEHLTLIVDRLDDLEKTKILAKAFSVFIKKQIDFNQFRRIARAIERCMIDDLVRVPQFIKANGEHSEITYELASAGLIQLVQLPQIRGKNAKPLYEITEFGELFCSLLLSRE